MSGETAAPTSVSTHILDTSVGRPAEGVALTLSVRAGRDAAWTAHGASTTDADGRCKDLPELPAGTTHVRLDFAVEEYFFPDQHSASDQHGAHRTAHQQAEEQQDAPRVRDSGAFFPEVAITFAVRPGEHYHVPLLLNPFGYSVYRGS
ncbi:hydroxyisourate hydrolase [Streptomyces tubercidicus]|uniref:5-hydroxyisourate hydrolase n=1 Tax=Streptomyces tubercidicus TaxID=47759 RepID=A0A640UK22_9ACTN|nr:hydroxyisourate hydrolase [Streptomyces tubercidicus]WAU11187.1 hydroxyisourate hydrolase [Streptomyces tubercidicus]GFE36413.1 5-hydroxyisourate hydrolase [Streptomyces tubercidicus]